MIEPDRALPDGFFAGCRARSLDADRSVPVTGYRARERSLTLADALPGAGAVAGGAVELLSPDPAPILGARLITATPHGRPLPAIELRLATTRGTNALLERRGAPTAFFVTRGFGDLLLIGTQERPDLFALDVRRPLPFHEVVVEVDERLAADGSVLRAPNLELVADRARELRQRGIKSAAVAFLHAYLEPRHESAVAAVLREAGFRHVACSAELAPLIGLLPRAETAVVEAYLAPVVGDYLEEVGRSADRGTLHVMTSAGGLVRGSAFRAKDSLLSGPAGGVVGAARAGRDAGFARIVAYDMGGTSTDVARADADFDYVYEHQVGDARLVAPALAIESVAAGGGSICRFDGRQLKVGPESAGASPGPACYGAGGPLTLTDVNLLLGRLAPERFGIPVAPEAAKAAAEAVLMGARAAGQELDLEALLAGFLAIADERTADALSAISLRRGYDPADHALVAFGGAGGQHACAVAERLGIRDVVVPVDAGLLSAAGLATAVIERFARRQVLAPLSADQPDLVTLLDELSTEAIAGVMAEGIAEPEVMVRRRVAHLRSVGQASALEVEVPAEQARSPQLPALLAEAFAVEYHTLYGYRPAPRAVEVEALSVIASSRSRAAVAAAVEGAEDAAAEAPRDQRLHSGGTWARVPVLTASAVPESRSLPGPLLVADAYSTAVVDRGWAARRHASGALVLSRQIESGEERE